MDISTYTLGNEFDIRDKFSPTAIGNGLYRNFQFVVEDALGMWLLFVALEEVQECVVMSTNIQAQLR